MHPSASPAGTPDLVCSSAGSPPDGPQPLEPAVLGRPAVEAQGEYLSVLCHWITVLKHKFAEILTQKNVRASLCHNNSNCFALSQKNQKKFFLDICEIKTRKACGFHFHR